MNTRKVDYWAKTAAEAFGETGERGREGELFVKAYLESLGFPVIDNEEDYATQVSGQDLIFTVEGKQHSVDVKSNLTDNNIFYVELHPTGWLFNPQKKSNLICHVNPRRQNMFWYTRENMKIYIDSLGEQKRSLLRLDGKSLPSFIKEKKIG
jgi:hypothetical protein